MNLNPLKISSRRQRDTRTVYMPRPGPDTEPEQHSAAGRWISGPWPSDPAAPVAQEPDPLPEWERELLEREDRARRSVDVPLYRVPMLEDLRADEVLVAAEPGSQSIADFLHPWFHGDDECQWEPAWVCPVRGRAVQVASTMLTVFPGLQDSEAIEQSYRLEARQAWSAAIEHARKAVGNAARPLLMLEQRDVAIMLDDIYAAVLGLHESNPWGGGNAFAGEAAVPRCRVCGCTDDVACSPPCSWVEGDLCSACAAVALVAGLEV